MSSLVEAFARAVVWARALIVLAWVATAVVFAVELPSLEEAQTGALDDIVPAGSEAIEAEELAVELFAFPLASRTVVVERDPDGLSATRIAVNALRIVETNRGELDVAHPPLGAYGIVNALPGLTFSRERGTTAVTGLLLNPESNQIAHVNGAREYVDALRVPPDNFVGVTGTVPARAAQADVISGRLPLIELVTMVLVSVTVAVYLRSLLAPLVTLLTVVVAYIVSIRVVAVVGSSIGVSVPPEVEPIIVALLFGVVTDYGLFYMSRFRRRLAEVSDPREAATRTTAELTPVILACGLAVAVGTAALVVADLGFLRAFGPGMAIAVLVALMVTMTLLPATLALAGRRLFWPSSLRHPAHDAPGPGRVERITAVAVDRPRMTIVACLVLLAIPASGLSGLRVGNPVIEGLPVDSEPREAYRQLSQGFAPGVVAPTTLIVVAPGVTERRSELASLQRRLARQPGVAGVLGPGTNPSDRDIGIVLSRTGDAARFVVILERDPHGAAAVRTVARLDARTDGLLDAAGLSGARGLYAGDTAIVADIIATANDDLVRVAPLVLLGVALVLMVLLRALVAPLYLVLLAALSPLAAMGLAALFFQDFLGHAEITYFVPLAAGVLLVALGSDYNIFLVGRIWREAREKPLREAIISAGGGASHAISAAGLVLAASFGALALVPVNAFRELAFVLAVGLLIDAFLVRSVLTPAVVSLVGERSGWPGRSLRSSTPARTVLGEGLEVGQSRAAPGGD
jgi:RND superfamily putative drug exporter